MKHSRNLSRNFVKQIYGFKKYKKLLQNLKSARNKKIFLNLDMIF